MENASKALIIAGAILLSILLISLGIMIFNQAQDTISNSGMSKAEISAFNGQFTKYEGTKRGSDVKSLIQEVIASNASDTADANGRSIKVYDMGTGKIDATTGGTELKSAASIQSTKSYDVRIVSYDNSGFISRINIKGK